MKIKTFGFMFSLILVLSACAGSSNTSIAPPSPVSPVKNNTYFYECKDHYSFTARVEGTKIWLFLRDGTISLPLVRSGSGTKYSDGHNIFWSKGENAMISTRGRDYNDCRNNAKQAVWENAKLNGVDFRAVGNEPGWDLEITKDEQIQFNTDYGQSQYNFDSTQPITDPTLKKTVYSTINGDDHLTITLEGLVCMDTMSDDSYETTVIVNFNGKIFQGCGKALH